MAITISDIRKRKAHNPSVHKDESGRNADLTLIKKMLNGELRINLEVGLEKTYHWESATSVCKNRAKSKLKNCSEIEAV